MSLLMKKIGKVTAEEESSEKKLITLDFGNYDEPIDEEEEESEADESSRDDVREVQQPSSENHGEEEVQQTERQLRDRKALRSSDRYSEFGYASLADAGKSRLEMLSILLVWKSNATVKIELLK